MAETTAIRAPRSLIAPGRYVQGRGVLAELGRYVAPIGSMPLILTDAVVKELTEATVTESFRRAGLPVRFEKFGGIPTAAEARRVADVAVERGCDVIVGLGGGTVIDTAKAAGDNAGIRWVSVPTVASTDAPTSALSVVYTEEGAFESYRFYARNPDLVLVDTQLVANAPVRFLVAGVGDALATWIEARAVQRASATTMAGGLATHAGIALARLSWDILWENAMPAVEAVRQNLVTPAVEAVVEANTLLSGLGFESGGLGAAHAVHDGLTAVPHTHHLVHGEKVNIGSITQLILEAAPTAEIRRFVEFTARLGLPTTLTEAGLGDADEEVLRAVVAAATAPEETIHNLPFPVSADDVLDALKAVEVLGRSVRAEAGLPEPQAPESLRTRVPTARMA
ncbi:glycerol dehydrogenase [Thermobifida cellulosilytica]|uniref:Glycerol dehydrogenase n=1 Tax=Thermobifida cellulosilytica TB100 TaxID=665004 RepID=A0A147KI74_THECS|nr:glycerol dehydrogenase [Thermobifida cellulosilytica]KUP97002.1 glycerol dehydrogenase [Thermobifida cellulosilytica TB100]